MKDDRTLELELDLPGTPEQVWHAIATSAGNSAWFGPTKVEEKVGGAIEFQMGEDMSSKGVIRVCERSRRFAYEEPNWMPNMPPLATEYVLTPIDQGTRLKITTRAERGTPELTSMMKKMEQGWAWHLNALRIYLGYFADQQASMVRVQGEAAGHTKAEAYATFARLLGFADAIEGERKQTPPGVPTLEGVVVRSPGLKKGPDDHDLIMRLDQPAKGFAMFSVWSWGSPHVNVSVQLSFFGHGAEAVAKREEPIWREWIAQHFPKQAKKK